MSATPPESAPGSFLLAVPYYAGLDLLRVTLDSVVRQDDRDWTCVVLDDAPTPDGAAEAVAALADPRVTYQRNPQHLGVAGAFNRCFELAAESGVSLVAIVHADDVLEPSYVTVARAAHARHPEAACVAPHVSVIDAAGRPCRPLPDLVKAALWPRHRDRLVGEDGLRLLLRGQFFHCPSLSYRVALLPARAWNERWGQVMDLELYANLLLDGGTIALEPARTFRYRRHAASATQVNSATLVRSQEETELLRELSAAAARRGWVRAARTGRLRLTVRLQALLQAVLLVVRRRPSVARQALGLAFAS